MPVPVEYPVDVLGLIEDEGNHPWERPTLRGAEEESSPIPPWSISLVNPESNSGHRLDRLESYSL